MRSTFIPHHKGVLFRVVEYSVTGSETPSDPVNIKYSVVFLRRKTRSTSVRTDQSGTQGRAEEEVFDGRILVAAWAQQPDGKQIELEPLEGGRIELNGRWYTVQEVQPRYGSFGLLDHWQLDLEL